VSLCHDARRGVRFDAQQFRHDRGHCAVDHGQRTEYRQLQLLRALPGRGRQRQPRRLHDQFLDRGRSRHGSAHSLNHFPVRYRDYRWSDKHHGECFGQRRGRGRSVLAQRRKSWARDH
jgi:hypothetical protein